MPLAADDITLEFSVLPANAKDRLAEFAFRKRALALSAHLAEAAKSHPEPIPVCRAWAALSQESQADICCHPFFNRWIYRFARSFGSSRNHIGTVMSELANHLLVPALREGVLPATGLVLHADSAHRISFFDSRTAFYLCRRSTECVSIAVRTSGHEVQIAALETNHIWTLDLGALVGTSEALGLPPVIASLPREPCTNVPVDSHHDQVVTFMRELNKQDSEHRVADLRPVELSTETSCRFSEALQLIGEAWPEMGLEIVRNVRQFAPFASSWRKAFTNTTWQGMVFVNGAFSDIVEIVDALVHEASHLQLNAVMSVAPLHMWGPHKTVPSPFRTGERPVDGVYHGVFVFARVCMLLERIAQYTGDSRFRAPIDGMLTAVDQGTGTLRSLGGESALGQKMLCEVEDVLAPIRADARMTV